MKDVRILLTSLAVAIAGLAASAHDAHAQRRMLVLIDASGSMGLARPGDAVNPTRFHAAKARSTQQILAQEMLGLSGVAVYTFTNSSSTPRTAGFVSVNDALDAIDALDPNADVGGITPLAGSMCDAVDALVADGGATRILQVSSDGAENNTPPGHPCFGPFSASSTEPYTAGSWENLVYNHAVDNVIVRIDLFNPDPIVELAARRADPEAAATRKAQPLARAGLAEDRPPTLVEFFGALARATGGELNVINDSAPLPVYGDLNADYCVDQTDANLVARKLGRTVAEVDSRLDLDQNGVIGFADYQVVLDNIDGTCGTPDTMVALAPVTCRGAQQIVIDGKKIETAGTAITATGACRITIKNSRIVAGEAAISTVGAARVVIENSHIAGEYASVDVLGAAHLRALNTIFTGVKLVVGALVYEDRGGNVWE
jgi:hypothetical protein